ncbi:MAG: aminodeoxychorismate synthase component I [Thioalkalispiraceae bacterium]|jgi:anthranilate synthase component 1
MVRALEQHANNKPSASDMMPRVKRIKGRLDLRQLNAVNPRQFPFLLESTAVSDTQHSSNSRYDILFAFPQQTLQLGSDLKLYDQAHQALADNDFLAELDHQWHKCRQDYVNDSKLPFSGGWFLFLGYELAQQVEPRLHLPMPEDGFPVACAVRIPAAVIYDHVLEETIYVTEGNKPELIARMEQALSGLCEEKDEALPGSLSVALDEDDEQRYIESVAKVKQYITEGDVFQVNLSRSWKGKRPQDLHASQIYQRLSQTNPAPFSGIMHFPFGDIISSSPERLIKVMDRHVETRPIAGTRPRSMNASSDNQFKNELIAHPKERAEHIMLIDLERNDLGRICQPGSIHVSEMMVTESYAHVHHIVSNIEGQLRNEVTPGEAIRAVFPGGTITGCPKERCMAIIAEQEQEARGAYTGSAGYLNHNGDMDLNILIRTISMTDKEIRLRTGAGLVFDSVARYELEETRHKAKGLLLALGALHE